MRKWLLASFIFAFVWLFLIVDSLVLLKRRILSKSRIAMGTIINFKNKESLLNNIPIVGPFASVSSLMLLKSFLAGKEFTTSFNLALEGHWFVVLNINVINNKITRQSFKFYCQSLSDLSFKPLTSDRKWNILTYSRKKYTNSFEFSNFALQSSVSTDRSLLI